MLCESYQGEHKMTFRDGRIIQFIADNFTDAQLYAAATWWADRLPGRG